MTGMECRVQRQTVAAYRFRASGAWPDATGRRLVVRLQDDQVFIREAGRRKWFATSAADLYARLVAQGAEQDPNR